MGEQIIKQPDGKYAIWSSFIDNFTYLNLTKEEVIEIKTREAINRIKLEINEIIEIIDNNKKRTQFTLDWKDALKKVKEIHGDKEVNKINKEIKEEYYEM